MTFTCEVCCVGAGARRWETSHTVTQPAATKNCFDRLITCYCTTGGLSENAETQGLVDTQGLHSLIVEQVVVVQEINYSNIKQIKSSLFPVAVNVA